MKEESDGDKSSAGGPAVDRRGRRVLPRCARPDGLLVARRGEGPAWATGWQAGSLPGRGRQGVVRVLVDGGVGVMTLGLGEHGDVFYATENGRVVAMVYYRDYSGMRRRLRSNGRSKAEARRRVNDALSRALAVGADGDFSARSTLA